MSISSARYPPVQRDAEPEKLPLPKNGQTRRVVVPPIRWGSSTTSRRLDPTDAEAARTDALTIYGTMIGTLQLARALTDRDLSGQLLARGVETALRLLDDRA